MIVGGYARCARMLMKSQASNRVAVA